MNLYKIQLKRERSLQLDIPKTPRNYWKCPECGNENIFVSRSNKCEVNECSGTLNIQDFVKDIKMIRHYRMKMERLFDMFTKLEMIPLSEQVVLSDVCDSKPYTQIEWKLMTLPYVLPVTFKRTVYSKQTRRPVRIEVPVDVPLILDCQKYIDPTVGIMPNTTTIYDLHTIVWHGGNSPSGGHYKVWSKQGGHWVEFNDKMTKKVDLKITKYQDDPTKEYIEDYHKDSYTWSIYMVVYTRQDISSFDLSRVQVHTHTVTEEGVVVEDDQPTPTTDATETTATAATTTTDKPLSPVEEQETEQLGQTQSVPVPEVQTVPVPEEQLSKQKAPLKPLVDIPVLEIDLDLDLSDFEMVGDPTEQVVEMPSLEEMKLKVDFELIEIVLNFSEEPTNKALLGNTKWLEEDGEYFLAYEENDEPVRFFMTCVENKSKGTKLSDGHRVPIDNKVYVEQDNGQNEGNVVEYAIITGITNQLNDTQTESTGQKIKEIENGVFDGKYQL